MSEELPMHSMDHMPFCIDCGKIFDQCVEGMLMTLKCGCTRERVYVPNQWRHMESIGYGAGMTAVIFGMVDFSKGVGTQQQMVDEFVREVIGDHSECDVAKAVELFRARRVANG